MIRCRKSIFIYILILYFDIFYLHYWNNKVISAVCLSNMPLLMLFSYLCSKCSTCVWSGAMKSTFPHGFSCSHGDTWDAFWKDLILEMFVFQASEQFSCKKPKHNNSFAVLQCKQPLRGHVLLHPCSYVFPPTHAIPFWNHYFIMSTTKIWKWPVTRAPTSQQVQLCWRSMTFGLCSSNCSKNNKGGKKYARFQVTLGGLRLLPVTPGVTLTNSSLF